VNQTEHDRVKMPSKSTLVHLEDMALGRPDRAWCGAKVRKTLPESIEVDCVVCAEMARAAGYDV